MKNSNILKQQFLLGESLSLLTGASLTFLFAETYGFHSIIVASALSTFVSILFSKRISYPFYCGTFVGMVSSEILPGHFIFLPIILSSLIYSMSKSYFKGYGGKLGTIAFLGVAIALLIIESLN